MGEIEKIEKMQHENTKRVTSSIPRSFSLGNCPRGAKKSMVLKALLAIIAKVLPQNSKQ